ncbi:uncharacterized protein FOMMEDRAFT_84119 [Fomitiporia mediterranea MF3/22]|uniref:uncharacterized protein n=1 Tax=Fomitiporia mediterranea (strain MF3/22) TaxID=694068 RepID=UPI00044095BA|nr:uncharacterized protein FOMMEDRAFT_84119 [Fomitiporia mediterranea MF3/22]EJD04248.1 hypothetical protein FOMMEDRAFT_84119 [Fomitiporia mediterranea MF3/22]
MRLRLIHLAVTAAMVLSIVGAVKSNTTDSGEKQTASTLRKVGGILFAATFVAIILVHLVFWQAQRDLMKYQKTLLKGISCALPFLAIRVLYSVLSAFSPPASFGSLGSPSGSTSGLAKFNSITGSWQLFLVMAVIMEFIVVATYIFFGLRLPISGGVDYESTATSSPFSRSIPLNSNAGFQSYPPSKANLNGDQYA